MQQCVYDDCDRMIREAKHKSSAVRLGGVLLATLLWAAPAFGHPDLIEQIVALTNQLNEQGESEDLFRTRADLFRRHAQFDAALLDLQRAAQLGTNRIELPLDRARVLCDAGQADAALKEINCYLVTAPRHGEARLIRARCLARLQQWEAAEADYDQAIQLCAHPAPNLYLERARACAQQGKLDRAVHGLDEAIAGSVTASPLQLAAIDYDRQRGAFAAALNRVDHLVTAYPVKEPWLTLRAEVLEQAGRPDEAKQTFERVIAGIAAYPTLRRSLGLTKQLEARAQQGLARLATKQKSPPSHQ